jgi:hypothetical protein
MSVLPFVPVLTPTSDPARSVGRPSKHEPVPAGARLGSPVAQFRCADCGYAASRSTAPERCPMCGERAWAHDHWRPFSLGGMSGALLPATRGGEYVE